MKIILSIINSDDSHEVSTALTNGGFQVTKLATSGGFLKKGNVTFLTGTSDDKVDEVIDIISKNSSKRGQIVPSTTAELDAILFNAVPFEVTVGGATIFVINVDQFLKI